MKRGSLWQIAITTAPQAEAAVGEFLENLLGQPPAIYTDAASGRSTVTVYLPELPEYPIGRANPRERRHAGLRRAARLRRILSAGLRGIAAGRTRALRSKIELARLLRRDWAESWKRHFRPLEIGPALLVKPSWSRRRPRRGQAVVVLDPGLSFGTGQHPTTAFCLCHLAARRADGRPNSFLDVGTGSGILAIAAAKLGYAPVRALDYDPEAVRVARVNARWNGVARLVRISRRDLTTLPPRSRERFGVICANLTSPLLLACRDRLANRLRLGGWLVLAGILKREFDEVRRAYEATGLKLVASRSEAEWRSGAFRRPL